MTWDGILSSLTGKDILFPPHFKLIPYPTHQLSLSLLPTVHTVPRLSSTSQASELALVVLTTARRRLSHPSPLSIAAVYRIHPSLASSLHQLP